MANKKIEPQINICKGCGIPFETGGRGRPRKKQEFHSKECEGKARYRTGSEANPLTTVQAAYMAGLLDGEGSIFLYKRRDAVCLRITISNTFVSVLEWCKQFTGVGNIVKAKRNNDKHKTGHMWLVNSQAAASILRQIEPYMIIKKAQAQLAIEFQEKLSIPSLKIDRKWQYKDLKAMKQFNIRGPIIS